MEMKQNSCTCPGSNPSSNHGLKLGHNKSSTNANPNIALANNGVNTGTTNEATKIIHNYAADRGREPNFHEQLADKTTTAKLNSRMKSRNTGYSFQPTRMTSLPAAPQTLFKQEQLLGMLEDFAKHMYDALTSNNINVPPSIKLGLNSGEDIHVLGHHPDQGKIEALFGNNSMLADKLHQIAFTSHVQQLDKLQSGFRNEFLNYPGNSLEQISFVHLRAVALSPFSMTIDQPESTTNPAMDKQGQDGALTLIHMMISRSREFSATQQQAPTKAQENNKAVPEQTARAQQGNEATEQSSTDTKAWMPKADAHKFKHDDPEPPVTLPPEADKAAKHRHIHKSKLRCIINR